MKKDLFKIDSDEVKRILSLHEGRSKNQYLGILSEQFKTVKYVTSKQNCLSDGRCIPPGTTFVPLSENVAIAYGVILNKQERPVNVKFYCKSPDLRFGMMYQAGELTGYNDLLKSVLTQKVCGHPKNQPSNLVKKKPKITIDQSEMGTAKKKPLTDAEKLDRAKKCGHNTWEDYKNSKWACTPPQQVKTPGGQTTSQTATVTKQIQTSLGTATPTGKITDAELDAILAKLG